MPPVTRSQTARRRARSSKQYSPSSRQRDSIGRSREFYKDSNQDQTLCVECRKLDLDCYFDGRHVDAEGRPTNTAPSFKLIRWSVGSCPLCILLDRTFGIKKRLRNRKPVLLRFDPRKVRCPGWLLVETGLISINPISIYPCPTDTRVCLAPQPDGILAVRKLKPLTSFLLLRDWLGFCRQHHTNACSTRKQDAASLALIPSFKLLDCRTGELVSGNVEPYTALSYVWGVDKRIAHHSPSGKWDLRQLPGTIRDAVEATKRLGLRYLWVDQLCINQLDESELHEQTSKMDLIYGNAEVTIIAAAGTDLHHGLPGVRPRKLLQHEAKIGNFLMRSTMEDPMQLIRSSQWHSRGWTYQEGILSRRRLVFTDQQVYYECSSMYCCEALNSSLSDFHTEDSQAFKPELVHGIDMGMFPRQLGNYPTEVLRRIQEYTKRTLSNPADILKGFLGIMRVLEEGPSYIRHCMGVPILSNRREIHPDIAPVIKVAQSNRLSNWWSTTAGFCLGLSWRSTKLYEPRRRRVGFPSWSWAGWFGEVSWPPNPLTYEIYTQDDMDFKVSVQLKDGRILTWDDFHQSYHELSRQISSTLHISAWATPLQLREIRDEWGNREWKIGAEMTNGRNSRELCMPRTLEEIPSTKLLGIHLYFFYNPFNDEYQHRVLVVYETESPGTYERIGCIDISKGVVKSRETFKLC